MRWYPTQGHLLCAQSHVVSLFPPPTSIQFSSAHSIFCRELSELQKANAVTQSAAQEAALSAEQSTREELKSVLEQEKAKSQREKDTLLLQVINQMVCISRVAYTVICWYLDCRWKNFVWV